MVFLKALILALSLCADSFAVSACAGMGLRKPFFRRALLVAAVFAAIHTSFLAAGLFAGNLAAGFITRAAKILGVSLLAGVGVSMVVKASSDHEHVSLMSFGEVLLGAVATSLDAFAVGISLSLSGCTPQQAAADCAVLLLITAASVLLGMAGGHALGDKYGPAAARIGGLVLIAIAFHSIF